MSVLPSRYEVREPEDGQWGLLTSNGNWTGLVGTLQHENADFSVDITVTRQRSEVVDFTAIYIQEPVVILSSKPRPLPEYLSLVRPLEGKFTVKSSQIFILHHHLILESKVVVGAHRS